MNEKFFKLPCEKQNIIINAGYQVFACFPYKKAPMSLVAETANISKSLLFHYFENKKDYYLFLFENAIATVKADMGDYFFSTDDFFEILSITSRIRIQSMQRHPYIWKFIMSAYYENENIIEKELTIFKKHMTQNSKDIVLAHINQKKFKNPENISTLYDIILYMSEGYIARNKDDIFLNPNCILDETANIFEVLKKNFYG